MDAGQSQEGFRPQPEPSLFKCNKIQHRNRELICCHRPPTHDERLRPVMLGLRLVLWQLRLMGSLSRVTRNSKFSHLLGIDV